MGSDDEDEKSRKSATLDPKKATDLNSPEEAKQSSTKRAAAVSKDLRVPHRLGFLAYDSTTGQRCPKNDRILDREDPKGYVKISAQSIVRKIWDYEMMDENAQYGEVMGAAIMGTTDIERKLRQGRPEGVIYRVMFNEMESPMAWDDENQCVKKEWDKEGFMTFRDLVNDDKFQDIAENLHRNMETMSIGAQLQLCARVAGDKKGADDGFKTIFEIIKCGSNSMSSTTRGVLEPILDIMALDAKSLIHTGDEFKEHTLGLTSKIEKAILAGRIKPKIALTMVLIALAENVMNQLVGTELDGPAQAAINDKLLHDNNMSAKDVDKMSANDTITRMARIFDEKRKRELTNKKMGNVDETNLATDGRTHARARITTMANKDIQCFRCGGYGHIAKECKKVAEHQIMCFACKAVVDKNEWIDHKSTCKARSENANNTRGWETQRGGARGGKPWRGRGGRGAQRGRGRGRGGRKGVSYRELLNRVTELEKKDAASQVDEEDEYDEYDEDDEYDQ